MRSGEPLNEQQRFLLNNLPTHSDSHETNIGHPEAPLYFVPRDATYERLCALAKSANESDLEFNPGSHDWEFAFNFLKLHRHPMCRLLQWAGMKQRRPWWDRLLLIIAAMLFIILATPLMLLIDRTRSVWRWTAFIAGYVVIVFLMYFASRRIEERQLERNVEECRSASRFART